MCVYYMTGAPKGSPKVVLWKALAILDIGQARLRLNCQAM